MATRMLQRRGTAAEWAAENPILESGEIGFETDTKLMKMGDGITPWNSLILPYMPTSGGTMTGGLVFNEQAITRPELVGYQENEVSDALATLTVDFHAAQLFQSTRTGAVTVAWANLPAAGKVRVATLIFESTVTGITFPVGTLFAGGSAPAMDGQTWVSVVARGTTVTVGAAWTGVA